MEIALATVTRMPCRVKNMAKSSSPNHENEQTETTNEKVNPKTVLGLHQRVCKRM